MQRRLTHTIEICSADQGKYKITIYEHSDELYRLTVRIGVSEALTAVLQSREARIREFSFVFKQKSDAPYLSWLDRNDRPSLYLHVDR
jgi:hypothetical protein